MAPFLKPRAERLARMFPHPAINRTLLKVYPIHTDVIVALAKRVLAKSFGLDNITPNGAVMERPAIANHYRLLREAVVSELDLRDLSHVSDPILRAPTASQPDRPFSIEKMHSDIWRGEPRYSLNIVIPLWGCAHSVIKFREPERDDFRPLADFAQGDLSGFDYEVPFAEGFVYYFDSMLMHQTQRIDEGQRVSIDLRGLYAERVDDEASPWEPASKFVAVMETA